MAKRIDTRSLEIAAAHLYELSVFAGRTKGEKLKVPVSAEGFLFDADSAVKFLLELKRSKLIALEVKGVVYSLTGKGNDFYAAVRTIEKFWGGQRFFSQKEYVSLVHVCRSVADYEYASQRYRSRYNPVTSWNNKHRFSHGPLQGIHEMRG